MERIGLTPVPAERLGPPRIEECKAHLECTLERHLPFGDEVILIGRFVAVSVDREALEASDPYAYLRLFAFLENDAYGAIERARRV